MTFREQLLSNLGPSPDFAAPSPEPVALSERLRLVAYYLPQYHPIPENDAWWGSGFTEWTNVTKAVPRFAGHYQPHLPADLGFYDLRLPDTLRQQAELARHYGVSCFCFHYYWFGGRRLLDRPLRNLLANPDIDISFCINWANESWTRAWDGKERQILLRQSYSTEDDTAFALALEPLIRDRRYLRIGGRPVIMVYRPALLPDAAATVERWRDLFRQRGLGTPYFVMPQVFDAKDPRPHGFDAAAEFPPHKVGWGVPDIAYMCRPFDPAYSGQALSYDHMVRNAMREQPLGYKLFRGVCPSWDNDARKPNRGVTFVNSTPEKYREWLYWACREAVRMPDLEENLVFINAWNEWAEGTHLEPDRHYGHAYLKATAEAYAAATGSAKGDWPAAIETGPPTLHRRQMNGVARLKAPLRALWYSRLARYGAGFREKPTPR